MSDATSERAYQEAVHYLQLGLLNQAVERLRHVLAEDPDDAAAHALLSLCLHDLKRPHAALLEAELAITLDPEAPLSHHAMGAALIANRRLGEAERHLTRALELDPEDADRHLALARLYRLTERRAERARHVERALTLAPSDASVLVAAGWLALETGELDAAHARAEQALREEPGSVEALVLTGHVWLRRGDLEQARDHALWALRQEPSDHGALHLLAGIKARQSLLLGLWWRLNAWLNERGPRGAIAILIGAFVVQRVLTLAFGDLGYPSAAEAVSLLWFGVCIYTWVGPGLFKRSLDKELQGVQLRDF